MILDTRIFVLEKALHVEKTVTSIIELFLNVEVLKKKALTNKSKNGGRDTKALVEHMSHDSLVIWA